MELRQYQKDISRQAVEIIQKFGLVYLSLEVRTGKTLTALSVCNEIELLNVLFVTKKKAIVSILADAKHFKSVNVIAINYESVHKITQQFDIVVVDESHSLGAFAKPSLRTKRLKEICKGKKIIYLSGTPSPESYSQLFHQFWISDYSPFAQYKNFYKWAADYVNIKKKYVYNRELNDYSDANKSLIDKQCSHLFISFTQKEAGFDVQLTEKILYVEPDKKITKAADMLLKNNIIEGKAGTVIADTAVKLQQKLHQIYSGTVKDEDGNIHILSHAKAEFIKKYFEGQRIAIFYKYIGEFNVLKHVFDNEYTSTPEIFQEGTKNVFVGQFVSSREGVRLDKADCIIFYNIDFSFLSYAQAKDRIISKERTKQAILYWIFTRGGIEEKIYNTVCNKKDYTLNYFRKDYEYYRMLKATRDLRDELIKSGSIDYINPKLMNI